MQTAFAFQGNTSIIRLTKDDAKKHTDHFGKLHELLLANEQMYPSIDRWINRKVIPGLKSGERIAYLAYQGEKPIASAVVKLGHHSKFCHLRIAEVSQDAGLGELFFTLMTLDVRETAKEIHFTLPEGLWEKKSGFFKSFGFAERVESGTQYRLFERELCCSAPFQTVWRSTQAKLPRVVSKLIGVDPVGDTVLLSLKPQWADAILERRKRIEIRRSFSRRWTQGQAFLYAGAPVQRIVGEARVVNVTEGAPAEIWKHCGHLTGATVEEFDAYTKGATTIFAIELENPRKYVPALSMTELRTMVDAPLRPPMSYANLASSPGWSSAVSLAAMIGTPMRHAFGI